MRNVSCGVSELCITGWADAVFVSYVMCVIVPCVMCLSLYGVSELCITGCANTVPVPCVMCLSLCHV